MAQTTDIRSLLKHLKIYENFNRDIFDWKTGGRERRRGESERKTGMVRSVKELRILRSNEDKFLKSMERKPQILNILEKKIWELLIALRTK